MTARITIATDHGELPALLDGERGGTILALGHGAGGSKDDALLEGFCRRLADRGIASLRFDFPYRVRGTKAPDREPVLREAWLAVHAEASTVGDPVWIGGKSLGGRIASLVAADGLDIGGLVFVGYPLHPPGKPDRLRDAHLPDIKAPMLFLQGTRDAFATWDLLEKTVGRLGSQAMMHPVEGGDHSFRVRGAKRDDAVTGATLADVAADFIQDPPG